MIKTKNPTCLKDYQDAFYTYWTDRKIEKGKGYKVFKRWEWYWNSRLNISDAFPPNDIIFKEFEAYLSTHPDKPSDYFGPSNWVFRGPSNSDGGYEGLGRINCIAFHPTNANTYWVGSPGGGIWKTTDNGKTWTTNYDKMPVLGVSNIVIDPKNANIIYIATGDGEGGATAYGFINGRGNTKSIGVLKSTNGGLNWSKTGLSWTVTDQVLVRKLLIHPNNSNILYAASSSGVYKTTNAGANWTQLLQNYYTDIEFKPNDP
ncbi:MAG: hypothetical protein ABIO44_05810, partial [Saprospiraceae bacterium]